MNKKLIIWFVWLTFVIIWNFVWINVPPIADVIVAVLLSLTSILVGKYWK